MTSAPSPQPTAPQPPTSRASRSKRIALACAKFLVPVFIIGYLLWSMDPEKWQSLREKDIAYPVLIGALGVAMTAMILSFVRWWILVRCQGITLSLLEALRLSSICFLLSFVSAGSVGGDLFKAVFLAQRSPGKRVAAFASVFVDRGSGLYGLLLLVSFGLLSRSSSDSFEFNGIGIDDIKWIVATLLTVGSSILAVLIFGGRFVDAAIAKLSAAPLIGPIVAKVGPSLRMFHAHPWAFGLSILMSLGVQALLVLSMHLIATSMYDAPPTLAEHFVIVPIGMFFSALPLTPAGLGVLEATIETLYHLIPQRVTDASGTLVALVFELVKVVLAILGTIFYWTAGKEVQDSLDYAEEHPDAMDEAMEELPSEDDGAVGNDSPRQAVSSN